MNNRLNDTATWLRAEEAHRRRAAVENDADRSRCRAVSSAVRSLKWSPLLFFFFFHFTHDAEVKL